LDDLVYWLKKCDFFFTYCSTAGAEAMMYNKPGIQLNFMVNKRKKIIENTGSLDYPFAKYRASLDLNTNEPEHLIKLLKSIYQSKNIRNELLQGRKNFWKIIVTMAALTLLKSFIPQFTIS
jgi:hypothetical protein